MFQYMIVEGEMKQMFGKGAKIKGWLVYLVRNRGMTIDVKVGLLKKYRSTYMYCMNQSWLQTKKERIVKVFDVKYFIC